MKTAMIHEDQLTNDPAPVAPVYEQKARIYGIGGPMAPELDSVGAVVEINEEGSDAGKKCPKCGDVKVPFSFGICKAHKNGLQSWCKACQGKRKRRSRCRPRSQRKKTEISQSKEKLRAKKWIAEHPEEHRARKRKQDERRRATTRGKLNAAMAVGLYKSVKKGSKGGQRWESLVGYTLAELKAHLEQRFKHGMTWENYGTCWHIDHKIPKAAFNYNIPGDLDFKRCWALRNLQPLEANKNRSKSDKMDKPFQPSLAM